MSLIRTFSKPVIGFLKVSFVVINSAKRILCTRIALLGIYLQCTAVVRGIRRMSWLLPLSGGLAYQRQRKEECDGEFHDGC